MTHPFGGYRQSGNARDKCCDSVLAYTQQKSTWVKLVSSQELCAWLKDNTLPISKLYATAAASVSR
jgi:hypothetical protein